MSMSAMKAQQTAYAYGAVEAALVEVLGIEDDALKAFKGRVRHLRNLGYPSGLPRPGPGRRIEYSFDQAMEMLVTLWLQHMGVTPRMAVGVGPGIVQLFKLISAGHMPHSPFSTPSQREHRAEGRDIYIVIKGKRGGPSGDAPTLEDMTFSFWTGYEDLIMQGLKGLDDGAILVNASGLVRKMEEALANTA
jgi:hypothetical protein